MPFTAVAIAGGVQALAGGIQDIGAGNKAQRYLAERRSFKISDEQYKTLQFGQSMSQSGYDAFTLKYLTESADRNFATSVNAIERMGGDVNDISGVYDQNQQVLGKIGAENNLIQAKNFGVYLNLMEGIAQGKDAEWQSEQDLIKDKQQAAQKNKEAGMKMLGDGISLASSALMQGEQSNLYKSENALNREALKLSKSPTTVNNGSKFTEFVGSDGAFPNEKIDYAEMFKAIPLSTTPNDMSSKGSYSFADLAKIMKMMQSGNIINRN